MPNPIIKRHEKNQKGRTLYYFIYKGKNSELFFFYHMSKAELQRTYSDYDKQYHKQKNISMHPFMAIIDTENAKNPTFMKHNDVVDNVTSIVQLTGKHHVDLTMSSTDNASSVSIRNPTLLT